MVWLPAPFMCLCLTFSSDRLLCRPASGKAAAKTRAPLPPAKKADDYMADIDLPSSESEGELETIKKDEEEEPKEFRPHVSVLEPSSHSQHPPGHLLWDVEANVASVRRQHPLYCAVYCTTLPGNGSEVPQRKYGYIHVSSTSAESAELRAPSSAQPESWCWEPEAGPACRR